MIYLFTALYCEAELFIKQFHLEKNIENMRFQEFYQERAGIRLTITGAGEIAAAAAVSSICTTYKPTEGDILLNIGTCAHLAGKSGVFVCNKIIEQATGKTFYPDLLYRHGLQEETIVTGMLPCNREESIVSGMSQYNQEKSFISGMSLHHQEESLISGMSSDHQKIVIASDVSLSGNGGCHEMLIENHRGFLYDMEAAGIYQVGTYFFGPHQMVFLKVVSDAGMAKTVSRENVEHLMKKHQDILCGFIKKISTFINENRQEENARQQEKIWTETLCTDLHCSKVMENSLKQHLHYLELAETDYVSVIQNMYQEGLLPVRDKREGKLRFEELKRRLL